MEMCHDRSSVILKDELHSHADIEAWIEVISAKVKEDFAQTGNNDGSHDFGHLQRVCSVAREFVRAEKGNELVAAAAGLLHDIVNLPKLDPNASQSARYAAQRSEELLKGLQFPVELIPNVCHCVHAHSFSAKVETKTVEARCVQDADRLESLGAFGLMRAFYCSGMFNSQILDENDPAAEHRDLNDKKFALDHFVRKLLTLYNTMKTEAGRMKALSLSTFLADYRNALIADHCAGNFSTGRFKIARVYQEAGEEKIALFHPEDPFAERGRELDATKYALDSLLTDEDSYIQHFLRQLKFELNGYQV